MPPTPTPLPPGVAQVFIPSSYSLWASAPYAIQSWNMAGQITTVIQLVILIAVLFAVAILVKKALTNILSGANEVAAAVTDSGRSSKAKRAKDAF